MKQLIIIPLLVITGFLIAGYLKLFSNQLSYQESIVTSDYTVLSLDNLENTQIKIIIGDSDAILVDLKGDKEDLAELDLESGDLFSTFGFSDKWKNVSGTITIPEGVLIEMTVSDQTDLVVEDVNGKSSFSNKQTVLIDTTGLDSISVDRLGQENGIQKSNVVIKDWGESEILDVSDWTLLKDETPNQEDQNLDNLTPADQPLEEVQQTPDNNEPDFLINEENLENQTNEPETVPEDQQQEITNDCSIGPTPIRNYCCQMANQEQDIECNGVGYWTFNQSVNQCIPNCNETPPENNISTPQEQIEESTNPSQNNSQNSNEEEVIEEEVIVYEDPTSQFCADLSKDEEDRTLCCNETLKNELSTGPRPGFPDCIGEWLFNYRDGCYFECAEHTRMLEILNELKQNAQSNQ